MEPSFKKFGIFFIIAFFILFSLFGIKEKYIVGSRGEGVTSTFFVLLVVSAIVGAALNMGFDKLVSRFKGSNRNASDK